MPNKGANVVCFFRTAQKSSTSCAAFGLTVTAHLDEDARWPVAFALNGLTTSEAPGIRASAQKAVSRV